MKIPAKKLFSNTNIIIFFGLIALYGTTVTISETNMACGSCHVDQEITWAKGTHQTINCVDCHIEPGIKGALKAQVMGVHDLYVAITRGNELSPHEEPLPISTENCMGCHNSILYFNEMGWYDLPDNTLKGQGLIMAHRTHVEREKIECVECHREITHRDPEFVGKYKTNWPFMFNDCGVCHNGQFNPRFNKTLTDVEDEDKKDCFQCHPYFTPPPVYEEGE